MKLIRSWREGWEVEVKEVASATEFEREDIHGGLEVEEDIENSPNTAEEGQEEREETENDGQKDYGQERQGYRDGKEESGGEDRQEQEQGTEQQEDAKNEVGADKRETGEGDGQKQEIENDGQGSEDMKGDYEQEGDQEESWEHEVGKEEEQEQEIENDGREDEDVEDDYGQEGDEEEGWENKDSLYQDKRVVPERWLQLAFTKLVARLGEETLLYEDGEEEWDIGKLLKRRFTLTPIHRCRRQKKKEPVVLALDFSGSCYAFSEFFLKVAKVAQRFKDVLVVDASNGFWEENRLIGQEGVLRWEELKGRKVIFFGDFDGGASLVRLSRMAKVWWFSCETRYEDLSEHDWCEGYKLKDFKGQYYRCLDEHDLMELCRKLTLERANRKDIDLFWEL